MLRVQLTVTLWSPLATTVTSAGGAGATSTLNAVVAWVDTGAPLVTAPMIF